MTWLWLFRFLFWIFSLRFYKWELRALGWFIPANWKNISQWHVQNLLTDSKSVLIFLRLMLISGLKIRLKFEADMNHPRERSTPWPFLGFPYSCDVLVSLIIFHPLILITVNSISCSSTKKHFLRWQILVNISELLLKKPIIYSHPFCQFEKNFKTEIKCCKATWKISQVFKS